MPPGVGLSTTPPVQREFLCISEAIRSLKLQKAEDRLKIIPIDFYESLKDVLLERGNYLVQRTWSLKIAACSWSTRSSKPKAKSPRLDRGHTMSGKLPSNGSDRERSYTSRTFHSSAWTNSDLAEKHNLAVESARKVTSYSKGKGPSNKASVPPFTASTSDRGRGGNNNLGRLKRAFKVW